MKTLWSMSTTVRNPERLVSFLRVLKQLEGLEFTEETQVKFQTLLIKERLYTPMGVPLKYRELFDDVTKEITYDVAKDIFDSQNYEDPPMRGRQSVNPLNKLGFSIAKDTAGAIKITSLGNLFISPDADASYIFFKSLLKLQFPNPVSTDFNEKKGFNVRPFIATLHLIKKVDGLSQTEFSFFIPTLINYEDIDKYADHIKHFRKLGSRREKDEFTFKFLKEFYGVDKLSDKQISNPSEYGDNSMRYFRLTKYFRVEKQSFREWRINLEPSRIKEIEQLLVLYDGSALKFSNIEEYITYISDIEKPELPWELDVDKSRSVIYSLIGTVEQEFQKLAHSLQVKLRNKYDSFMKLNISKLGLEELKKLIGSLRSFRLEILQISRDSALRRDIDELKQIVAVFKDKKKVRNLEPVEFEFMISLCLKILNDELEIKANCILDDDGNPIGFAPGNRADIEGFYDTFNSIFEATLDVSRHQVYRESMPVMRHLKDFSIKYSEKPAFCVFVAPKVHDDTINYFWNSVKFGFEGKKQFIIAFELEQFVRILEFFIETIKKKKSFSHLNIMELFEAIVTDVENKNSSVNWFRGISFLIENWQRSLL